MTTEKAAAAPVAVRRLTQHARGPELFVIFIVNQLLKIVTLGIYHFWGKTRIRRYVWANLSLDDERFEYTGTGKELFVGFLKAFLVLLGIVIVLSIAGVVLGTLMESVGPVFSGVLTAVAFVILFHMAKYNSRKYMLGRTHWRSIRFARSGSGEDYAWLALKYWALTVLTLGLYTPWRRHKLRMYALNNTWFGSARFVYDGQPRDLFRSFVISWLLAIPTIGLSMMWYYATEARYVAQRLQLCQMRFKLDLQGGPLLGLVVTNMLLTVLTLGLAYPWVVVRTVRFGTERLMLESDLDYDAIQQTPAMAPTTGEGLMELFGVSPI